MGNLDANTVEGFGEEWALFDQSRVSQGELERQFQQYFAVFPWQTLSAEARGFDLGCGSGRWARWMAPRVDTLHCIDASEQALSVARRTLDSHSNCVFHHASVDELPMADASMDFGYCLGVLHHLPDPGEGVRSAVAKLKPGAPLLVYAYYAVETRPAWFRALWRASDAVRRATSRLPVRAKLWLTSAIALLVYLPVARLALALDKAGVRVDGLPLSTYRHHSLYIMRNDAFDRFGTQLEQRFTAQQMAAMMRRAGLERIEFSPHPPYWCAVGYRAARRPAI